MQSEMRCDYCGQKTYSLYGWFNKMVCIKCHDELVCSIENSVSI